MEQLCTQLADFHENLLYSYVLEHLTIKFKFYSNLTRITGKSKGKAIPFGGLTGPEGSRRLRLPDFKTIST
jgi:hypothetical protein